VIVCNCAFLAAAACGSLGNEITTINPGPPWTEQTSTGNLASTTTTLPSLCPAFGTTQPLPKGAAFFIIEPLSTNSRLIEATTCVPAQGAAFGLQAFSSSGEQLGSCLCRCWRVRRARLSAGELLRSSHALCLRVLIVATAGEQSGQTHVLRQTPTSTRLQLTCVLSSCRPVPAADCSQLTASSAPCPGRTSWWCDIRIHILLDADQPIT
jgi:hypothetical protein